METSSSSDKVPGDQVEPPFGLGAAVRDAREREQFVR